MHLYPIIKFPINLNGRELIARLSPKDTVFEIFYLDYHIEYIEEKDLDEARKMIPTGIYRDKNYIEIVNTIEEKYETLNPKDKTNYIIDDSLELWHGGLINIKVENRYVDTGEILLNFFDGEEFYGESMMLEEVIVLRDKLNLVIQRLKNIE